MTGSDNLPTHMVFTAVDSSALWKAFHKADGQAFVATTLTDYFWPEIICDPGQPTALFLWSGHPTFRLRAAPFLGHPLDRALARRRVVSLSEV
ncbi:MAG: hypothetical protein ACYCVY_06850 [Acidiferrobacteraceae bacterium]